MGDGVCDTLAMLEELETMSLDETTELSDDDCAELVGIGALEEVDAISLDETVELSRRLCRA